MATDVFYINGSHTIPKLPDSTIYSNYIFAYIWKGELEVYANPVYYRVNDAVVRAYSVFRLHGLADDKYLEENGFDAEFIRNCVSTIIINWDGAIELDVDVNGQPNTYYETSQTNLVANDSTVVNLSIMPDSEWRDIDDMLIEMMTYWNDYHGVLDSNNLTKVYQYCDTTFFFPCAKMSEIKKILNAICNYTATGMKCNDDNILFFWRLANADDTPVIITSDNYEKIEVQYSVEDERYTRIIAYTKTTNILDCYIDNEDKDKYWRTNSVVNQIYEHKYLYNKVSEKVLFFPMVAWGNPADITRTHGKYFGNDNVMLQAMRWMLSSNVENKKRVIIKTMWDIELNLGDYVIIDSDYVTGFDGNKVRKYFQVTSVNLKKDYIEYTLTESYEIGFKIAPDTITTEIEDQYGIIAPDGCEYYESKYCAKVVCDWYRTR